MIDSKLSDLIKKRLVEAYNPKAIFLFGSYAWGKPNANSDIDLMVIMPDDIVLKQPESYIGYLALSDLEVPKDLVVISNNKFLERSNHPSTLQYKVLNEGIKIYGNI
jgi:uncharacterized protein